MSLIPQNLRKAVLYGFVIWLSGFVWGSMVLMIPALKGMEGIPYVSTNPAISLPIIILWIFLAAGLTKRYFKMTASRDNEALKLGITLFSVNFILDFMVLVVVFGNGFRFFLSLSVWVAYAVLILVPRKMGQGKSSSAAT